jgi:hypothetical protein
LFSTKEDDGRTSIKKVICISAITIVSSVAIAERPSIYGTVVDEKGNAISSAVVDVYTARPRIGTIPYCPSCYVDCRKQTSTDEEGHFSISSLDPKLLFKLLIVAEGHSPQFVNNVDPGKSPFVVSLLRIPTERLAVGHVIKGMITDPAGNPVTGAAVTPYAIEEKSEVKATDSSDSSFFDMEIDEQGKWDVKPRLSIHKMILPRPRPIHYNEIDPLAVSNEEGEFCLTSESSDLTVYVTIRALGLAAFPSYRLHTGLQTHHIELDRGVTVKGRLIHGGKPVDGASLGVIQTNRRFDAGFLGEYTTTTNSKGFFYIYNLPPNMDYYIYGKMESLQEVGALPEQQFRTGEHGSEQNLGELSLKQSYHVSGRVLLNDGGRIPEGTHILLSREKAWDSQIIKLDVNGYFTIKGIPAEAISIHVQVPGQRLSKNNPSLDPVSGRSLIGKVVDNYDDFLIELEPGEAIRIDQNRQSWEAQKQKQNMPLRGATVASRWKSGEQRD